MNTIKPFEPLRLESKSVSNFKDKCHPILGQNMVSRILNTDHKKNERKVNLAMAG